MDLPVAVVIPTYNRVAFVEMALRSVASQTCRPSQVIVVDDGSTDGTCELLESLDLDMDVELVRQTNAGPGAARNTGLEAARHSWVALLDSDDWWLPQHLERVWAAHEGHVLVSGNFLSSQAGRLMGNARRRDRVLRSTEDLLWPEMSVVTSGVLLERNVALRIGGFAPALRSEDLDLWLRMLDEGTGLSLAEVTGIYREHTGQVTADMAQMRTSLRDLLRTTSPGSVPTRLQGRIDDRLAWDELRAEDATSSREKLSRVLAWLVRSPSSGRSLAELLVWRWHARRGRERLARIHAEHSRQVTG